MAQQMYFDFHLHPVCKQFFTQYETDYPTGRGPDDISRVMDLQNDLTDFVDTYLLHILESQCCLNQMKQGGVQVGVANILSIEHGFADSNGDFANVLKSAWTRPLDQQYMKAVRLGQVSYYRLFIKELDLYRKLASKSDPRIHFLSRRHPASLKDNAFYVALSMEGGHNLSRLKIGNSGSYDTQPAKGTPDEVFKDFCNPPENGAESLKRLHAALWAEGMDLFYLTLTHLTYIKEQSLATHAYGMKLLKHGAFYPVGNGLTQLGKDVINAAYNMVATGDDGAPKPQPILIDIKHMALKSRQDFYACRRENGGYEKNPIVASHMGVTGYAASEWIDALSEQALYTDQGVRTVEILTKRKRAGAWGSALNNEFTFNPWSLNLMDDDIVEILKSGGIIGISLDVRILGFQSKFGASADDQPEYLSLENFKTFFPHLVLRGAGFKAAESLATAESWLVPTKEERHPICLCFNFLHIVSVGLRHQAEIGKTREEVWQQICIGSDFDGFIEPVKICRDASKMPALEQAVLKWLPVAEKAYVKENGGPRLLTWNRDRTVDDAELRKIVRGLMYENGKAFLQHWVAGTLDTRGNKTPAP